MNQKVIIFMIVVGIASLSALLQIWLVLSDSPDAQPLWIFIAGMIIVGGLLNIRRELNQ